MPFDEDLKRTFDALGDRLHAELQHQIDAALSDLRAAIPAPPPIVAAPPPAPEPPPAAAADLGPLGDAVRAIDAARSLTDVLDALAIGAAQHADGAAVILNRNGHRKTWRAIRLQEPFDTPDATSLALMMSNGEPFGVLLYAEGGSPQALEILACYAARCLESITAFKTARALARQANSPADEAANDEDAAARRYARLLVSEIKLYHEADVAAGRRERDLATRLGGEIARARVLYDQRVPPHVRERADYFRDELVRTLADGDSALLEFQA